MNNFNLSSCVVKSLKDREMVPELASSLLTKDKQEAVRRDETEYWDYKEIVDLDNPLEVARLAKRVLAFHNSKGGIIVFGIKDNYTVTGIPAGRVLDSNQLNQKLRHYTGSSFSVFQDSIAVPHNRVVWIIFVPPKEDVPVPVINNGPLNEKNRHEIRKGELYVRVNDTVKLCVEPNEIYRLFGNVSLSHIEAYLYDVDDPYFRLLTPHCDRFVGRQNQLNKVRDALFKSRHPIIALDGIGGVGKSAIAIEIVRSLYDSQKYMFIVSQSAKSKVWHEHMATRKAGFSGLTEFLQAIARVFQLPQEKDLDLLRASVISAMEGLEGLLLVDNLEDISDSAVFDFLVFDVPDPVKVLVTSRVDKGLGALTISIPQMTEAEAEELFYGELKRIGFADIYSDPESVAEIIRATGKIPLALKWAALVAMSNQSLKEASHRLRKLDATKKEFLTFCFASMFDVLSTVARQVAVLGVYLENACNSTTLSKILDISEAEIELAVEELKEKGILLDTFSAKRRALSFLPLTEDFLANRWNEDKGFREKALATMKALHINLSQTPEERQQHVLKLSDELSRKGKQLEALDHVNLALSLDSNNFTLTFLKGRLLYEVGRKRDGLNIMQVLLKTPEAQFFDENVYLALALIEYGTAESGKEGLRLLIWASRQRTALPFNASIALVRASVELRDFRGIPDILNKLTLASEAFEIVKELIPHLGDIDLILHCDRALPKALSLAIAGSQINVLQKAAIRSGIEEIDKILKSERERKELETKKEKKRNAASD